jgi:hypothetical protein
MFCAGVANGIEEPIEPFERKNMNLTRCVTLVSVECDEAPSHAGSSGFFELRVEGELCRLIRDFGAARLLEIL